MKKDLRIVKTLKITSIVFASILSLLLIFLVANKSFAIFTTKTDKVNYSFNTYRKPLLATGKEVQSRLKSYLSNNTTDGGVYGKITKVVFDINNYNKQYRTNAVDLSDKNNKSVLGYIDFSNNNSAYTLHIFTPFDKIIANPDSSWLFSGYKDDNSQTYYVFSGMKEIENLTSLDTSNVYTMWCMFYNSLELTKLDLSNFDTSNVVFMNSMFQNCSKLTTLYIDFKTDKLTTTGEMFNNCSSLKSLVFGNNFTTDNVNNMFRMFYNCSSLISLNIEKFNTEKVTNMAGMFKLCLKLETLTLGNKFITKEVTSMAEMFNEMRSIRKLDLSNFDTKKVTEMFDMFAGCEKLDSLDVSSFNTANVQTMKKMFWKCASLTSLSVSNFNTQNVSSLSGMFQQCTNLTKLDLSNFDTRNVTDMSYMFSGDYKLNNLIISNNFTTNKVTNMNNMFSLMGAISSTSLNSIITTFDTSKVTDMGAMFKGCTSLETLNLSNFDTSNVTNMSFMFGGPTPTKKDIEENKTPIKMALNSITFGDGFVTTKVTDLSGLFYGCREFTKIDFTGQSNAGKHIISKNLNFSSVTKMGAMFYGCTSLNSITFSNSVLNVNSMSYQFVKDDNDENSPDSYYAGMFENCTALQEIDLSLFDFNKITEINVTNLFNGSNNLTDIYVKDNTSQEKLNSYSTTASIPSTANVTIK